MKTGEDDDPIAIMTVLNTQRHAEAPFMPQILEYITSKCSDAAVKQQLQQVTSMACRKDCSCQNVHCRRHHVLNLLPYLALALMRLLNCMPPFLHPHLQPLFLQAWSAPGTGLLLNERLVNSPPQIAPPLVQALFEEIDQAAGDTADKVGRYGKHMCVLQLPKCPVVNSGS